MLYVMLYASDKNCAQPLKSKRGSAARVMYLRPLIVLAS